MLCALSPARTCRSLWWLWRVQTAWNRAERTADNGSAQALQLTLQRRGVPAIESAERAAASPPTWATRMISADARHDISARWVQRVQHTAFAAAAAAAHGGQLLAEPCEVRERVADRRRRRAAAAGGGRRVRGRARGERVQRRRALALVLRAAVRGAARVRCTTRGRRHACLVTEVQGAQGFLQLAGRAAKSKAGGPPQDNRTGTRIQVRAWWCVRTFCQLSCQPRERALAIPSARARQCVHVWRHRTRRWPRTGCRGLCP